MNEGLTGTRTVRPLELLACMGLGALALLASTANAGAHARVDRYSDDIPTKNVTYADLDLTTPRGIEALKRRISRAAEIVCGDLRMPDVELPAAYRNCVTTSTNGALAQVKWPAR